MSSSGGKVSLSTGTSVIGAVLTSSETNGSFEIISSARTASGGTGGLNFTGASELAIDLDVTALSGTSPTLQFSLIRVGLDGVNYTLWNSAVITTPEQISFTLGKGGSVNQAFGELIELNWTITGTSPSITFSGSMQGK